MKRPTIFSIAERAGVSIAAVSYALNGSPGVSAKTRQRILDIAKEDGWRPNIAARGLSISKAHAIGLVIERKTETLEVEPFFMRFIAGLEAELSAQRIALVLQVVTDHARAVDAIRTWWEERRVDGMIITDPWQHDDRIPLLEKMGVPAVVVGRPQEGCTLPAVWSDDAAAVTAVVDYLVRLKHRRISRVAGLPALDHTRVRNEAFQAAMQGHGLDGSDIVVTDYMSEAGVRATRALLARRNAPTAIVYDNDVMAAAATMVTREMGIRVPEDVSLVAGDDSQLCSLIHPPLTALSRDVAAYGKHAARTLLELIDTGEAACYQDETAHLVPRGSTARAPAADADADRFERQPSP